jgi:hypothetical protein
MLCDKCNNIHFRPLKQCDLIKQEPERLLFEGSKHSIDYYLFYIHHDSLQALRESSENGCHLCAMIHDNLFGEYGLFWKTKPFAFARGEIVFRRLWHPYDLERFEHWNTYDLGSVLCGDRECYITSHGIYSGACEHSN